LHTRTAATRAWKKKADLSAIAVVLTNLAKRDKELSLAAFDALEAIFARSGNDASPEDLQALERLDNVLLLESRDLSAQAECLEMDCRPLKISAHRELVRRGLAV
jgi:hypothetical protein